MSVKKYRVEFTGTIYVEAQSEDEAEQLLIANPELILKDDDLDVEAFEED